MSDTKVTAKLPSYVQWGGKTETSGPGKIEFNDNTGRIIWRVGSVDAAAGYTRPAPTASFSVSFKPSGSQQEEVPRLVRGVRLEATDSFTGLQLTDRLESPLTTSLIAEPDVGYGDDVGVVRD